MTTHGAPQESDAQVRNRTEYIGTDERGQHYLLKTERDPDEVVVVHGGERVLVDALHELAVRDVAATVAAEIGWRECHWAEFEAKHSALKYPGGRA